MQVQYDPARHEQGRRNRTLDIITSALSILNEDVVKEAESTAVTAYTSKTQQDDKETTGSTKTKRKEVQEDKHKEDDDSKPKTD